MRIIRKTNLDFLGKKYIGLILSIILIFCGLVSIVLNSGLKLSIDFTGGTVVQVLFKEIPDISTIRLNLDENGFENAEVIEFGSPNELLIKTNLLENTDEANKKLSAIFSGLEYEIRRIEMVGPKIGNELKKDAMYAISFALIGILIYVWFRFDKYYAAGSVIALIHDVLITLGLFSILNKEIDLSIIAAILTIVGYSLNDTIVVFDRIRENIQKNTKEKLEHVVNISLNETLARTLITSITTLVVVVILFFLGGEVINNFAFALTLGVLIGTYSSLFVASPVMVYLENRRSEKIVIE